jgi:(2Fe-2S) ferredoxin
MLRAALKALMAWMVWMGACKTGPVMCVTQSARWVNRYDSVVCAREEALRLVQSGAALEIVAVSLVFALAIFTLLAFVV